MLHNAAIFVNGQRIRKGVDVEWDETEVRLSNRSNHRVFETYKIEELAAETDDTAAWDILDARGQRVRLTAQRGCGCAGIIKNYEELSAYSGALTKK
jgi:hypothetical protein